MTWQYFLNAIFFPGVENLDYNLSYDIEKKSVSFIKVVAIEQKEIFVVSQFLIKSLKNKDF